jgi:hypothetical protein
MILTENKDIDSADSSNHLAESLDELTKSVQQANSLGRNFSIALLRGIGYTIGAGLIAGLLGAFVVKYFPFL